MSSTDPTTLLEAWRAEHAAAVAARIAGDREGEWRFLERAHILSQPMAAPHVRTHVAMLAFGVRHRDLREIVGQLVRIAVAAPGTLTGRYPMGNTGGADVRATAVMPIPADLQSILDGA